MTTVSFPFKIMLIGGVSKATLSAFRELKTLSNGLQREKAGLTLPFKPPANLATRIVNHLCIVIRFLVGSSFEKGKMMGKQYAEKFIPTHLEKASKCDQNLSFPNLQRKERLLMRKMEPGGGLKPLFCCANRISLKRLKFGSCALIVGMHLPPEPTLAGPNWSVTRNRFLPPIPWLPPSFPQAVQFIARNVQ